MTGTTMRKDSDFLDPRVYSWLLNALRNVHGSDILEVRAPILWPGMAEDSFNFNFYGKIARLATSGAFYLLLMASKYGDCYLIQRSFRPERHCTPCHLNEFDLYECCLRNVDFTKLLDEAESVLRKIYEDAKRNFPDLCKANLPQGPIKRYSWEDLSSKIESFSDINFRYSPQGKDFLQFQEKEPFFVTNMPRTQSASWLVKSDENNHFCSFDLILPGVGEVMEGSERPSRRNTYVKYLSQGANLARSFSWFLDEFEDQDQPISMFGCGIERLAMWLFGIDDIAYIHNPYRKNSFSELL